MHTKTIIVMLLALLSQAPVQAQLAAPEKKSSKSAYDFYMHKRKEQKTIGWITVGTGSAMVIAGLVIFASQPITILGPETDTNKNKGLWLSYTGGALTLIGIPFFICAGLNKKRARLAMKEEKVMLLPNAPANFHFTAISLKIAL